MDFDPRPLLKDIARGKHGARDLTRDQARALFEAIFAGGISDVALGATLVAVRLPPRRALPVILPTYNGARKLPNLVPLLALLLAREGVPVLLHGTTQEP